MMPARTTAALAALACLSAPLAAGAEPASLDDLRWNARPVVVFADTAEDPHLSRQLSALEAEAAGLAERDMVVLTDIASAPAETAALRARYAPEGFAVLLIGKDGGVKLRSDAPVEAGALFALVDGMPMRRREMQAD